MGGLKVSRRNFLMGGAMISGAGLVRAANIKQRPWPGNRDDVNCAIIGYGPQGRALASTLARVPGARLAAICDTYDPMLLRARRDVPEASRHTDYREVLDNPEIKAVLIATPTHLHKDLAIDALEAGKNVYCEAPMASSIEDAQALARAARDAPNQIFQVGQIYRSNPQHRSVFQFMRSGAIGKPAMGRGQWHSKESWRRTSPNADRIRALNWRLDPEVSLGLIGESCLLQMDVAFWVLGELPSAVHGFGQIMAWPDGREVPDTVQAVLQFPSGLHMLFDATLASSFDEAYEVYFGTDSTIIFRDRGKAWMFKEVDAPMLGWEVYARRDRFYKETGIALLANATQLDAQNQDPTEDDPNVETPLWYAMQEFMDNHAFGPYPPAADWARGLEATAIAVAANRAITQRTHINIDPAWYSLD
ncbi:MAG: Gfo/Idh/MocA family oxidoreductase [Bacteroidota bacterium]|nr:Gfo/Idh/MocA family oxidoreductase [Bacteroidota bacterium]MDE2957659.1 Gfo/Idh/MocA family oxidoreductase [Bacteroidota bacterium]